jgi:hypothetical protein
VHEDIASLNDKILCYLATMADVKPFRVSVPDSELKYLRQRLDSARYPDILTNIAPWEDGTDLEYFKVGEASSPGLSGRGLASQHYCNSYTGTVATLTLPISVSSLWQQCICMANLGSSFKMFMF